MSLTSYLAAPSRGWNHALFGAGREDEGLGTDCAREISQFLEKFFRLRERLWICRESHAFYLACLRDGVGELCLTQCCLEPVKARRKSRRRNAEAFAAARLAESGGDRCKTGKSA